MPLVQIVSYLAVLVAASAIFAKVYRYAAAPVHFRWELYPVPHEKGRGEYGNRKRVRGL